MSFNYVEKINGLRAEQRLHFYELLAHNLTVSIRGVWSDSGLPDSEKVDQMKWINEVLHQVTAKVWSLRLKTHQWTEADTWISIEGAVSQNPAINAPLSNAITNTYESVIGNTDN